MREAFQEILLRFSLCGLAASLVLLALRARSVRAACETLLGLWRVCRDMDELGDEPGGGAAAGAVVRAFRRSRWFVCLHCAHITCRCRAGDCFACGRMLFLLGDVAAWMGANDNASGHNACAIKRIGSNLIEYHYFHCEEHSVAGYHLFNSYSRVAETLILEVE